jgi:TonB-dependent receptor
MKMNHQQHPAAGSRRQRKWKLLIEAAKNAGQTGFRLALGLSFSLLLNFSTGESFAQDSKSGRLTGKVVDAETGEALVGANVVLEGTTLGAACDIEGNYRINNVPPGEHTLVFSMIGYAKVRLTAVKAVAGQVAKHDVALKPEILQATEVVITAEMVKNTEASLLKNRQKAIAVSDAISAEAISRSGSGDVAEAMTKVTGASVVDGKYVYVRGMGERYGMTALNGVEIPSADPDKKAVQMDMFPSNLLDNIVTIKSFTPDKPGSFSGGMVDIGTKTYPDNFTFKVSTGTTYNSQVSLSNDYLTYSGSSTDFLGYDNGLRDVPAVASGNAWIPTLTEAQRNPEAAAQLDKVTRAFEPVMAPVKDRAPIDRQLAVSVGNQITLFDRPLGFQGSLTYKRGYSFYDNGRSERWGLSTNVEQTESLNGKALFADIRGVDEVTWGALGALSSKIHPNHELNFNAYYSQSGESSSRYLYGPWPDQFGENSTSIFETRVLGYKQRNLQSYQLSGEHFLQGLFSSKVDWLAAYTSNSQKEPDVRYFSDHFTPSRIAGRDTILYNITTSNYAQPARYYRDMQEKGPNVALNLETPFSLWKGSKGKLKVGGYYSDKDRDFEELRFEYQRPSTFRYTGDPSSFFSDGSIGVIGFDAARNRPVFGNYIQLAADPRGGNYAGFEKISAAYGMVDLPLINRLRFIGGARFEATRMRVEGADAQKDPGLRIGEISEDDVLPSANLICQITDDMNLRAAYGKTLARPTLREMAPYVSYEFVNDYSFAGNVNLRRTLIDNYDLRWEWFSRPGEIYAVSGFYKRFDNAIERSIVPGVTPDNPEITYRNVDEGLLYGIEVEVRKSLDVVAKALSNFQLGMNLSLIHSEVDIPADKLASIKTVDPNRIEFADNTRPLQGQSPYLVNLDLSYDLAKTGTFIGVQFNRFGDRLTEVTSDATPDVYEKARSTVDLNVSQSLGHYLNLQLGVKNLTDEKIEFVHTFKDTDYIRRAYSTGRAFKLGLTYSIN